MYHYLEKQFLKNIDKIQASIPRHKPNVEKLKHCKIISHRGEHDNKTVFENTLEAFDAVLEAGVWGIELDIRWSKDNIPVVFHDRSLRRLFNNNLKLSKTNFKELREKFPLIPSLEEVIQRYGKKLHLMIEIKREIYLDPIKQMQTLRNIFKPLTPMQDYHFISLSPKMFKYIDFVPSKTFLPVVTRGYQKYSELVIAKHYGGILGHYQFLTKKVIQQHQTFGQDFGVGYVASKNSLYRELNRNVTWLFSNNAITMQKLLDEVIPGHSGHF